MTRSVAPWASSDEASLARTLAEIPRDVPSLVALARDGRAPGDAVGDAHPGPRDEPAWFCTPWLNRYAARLDRTLMFAEHESVDHRWRMIVAVSADHPDPVAEFRRLTAPYYQNPDSYPPLMRSEAANPDVPKHFVLVHDGRSTTTAEDVAATFDDAKTNLGDDAVSLLPVNSGPGAHPVPDVWSAHAEIRVVTGDGSEAGGSEVGGSEAGGSEAGGSERSSDVAEKGALMSDSDVVAHRRFVERFAVASLIPAMEARLRALNANISATRKGLKNQFKSFWGRSTGQIAKPEGDGGYTFRSAESEIRVAADLAFALRDHDTAAQHYRLLQSDYKADKAWRRLGAAQEALGHALALSKPEATWIAEGAPFRECRRDAERELEQAAQCFARAHVNGNGAVSGAVSAPTRRAPRPHRWAGPGAWRSGRDSRPAPASRTPRSSPRAARTGKPPRRSCASPPRRDRRTFAGDYSSRRRLRNTAERRPPWCANAPYISSSRGTDTTRGVQGARYSVLRRGVTRVSARRRAVGDDWIGGRNGGRRLDARFGFKRLGGVRGEMESRDGTSSLRARATGCARGFDPRRGRVFSAIVGVREAPTRGDAIHLPPRVSLRREVPPTRRRRRKKRN